MSSRGPSRRGRPALLRGILSDSGFPERVDARGESKIKSSTEHGSARLEAFSDPGSIPGASTTHRIHTAVRSIRRVCPWPLGHVTESAALRIGDYGPRSEGDDESTGAPAGIRHAHGDFSRREAPARRSARTRSALFVPCRRGRVRRVVFSRRPRPLAETDSPATPAVRRALLALE